VGFHEDVALPTSVEERGVVGEYLEIVMDRFHHGFFTMLPESCEDSFLGSFTICRYPGDLVLVPEKNYFFDRGYIYIII